MIKFHLNISTFKQSRRDSTRKLP